MNEEPQTYKPLSDIVACPTCGKIECRRDASSWPRFEEREQLEAEITRLRADVDSLQRQLDGDEEDEPPLTPEELAELVAADERYLASLTPLQREIVLGVRARLSRTIFFGTGDSSEPKGLFVR